MDTDYDSPDNKKRIEEERKRDEERFLERKRLQEKEAKELHERAIKGDIDKLQRTLDKKNLELRAVEYEKPSLEARIRNAKIKYNHATNEDIHTDERKIDDIKHTIEELDRTEDSLEKELAEVQEKKKREENELSSFENKREKDVTTQDKVRDDAEDEEDTAKKRLFSKQRESKGLESEINRIEDEINSLKRELL